MAFARGGLTLARRQRPETGVAAALSDEMRLLRREPRPMQRYWSECRPRKDATMRGKSGKAKHDSRHRSVGGAGPRHRHHRGRLLFRPSSAAAGHQRLHRAKPDRPLVRRLGRDFSLARKPLETTRLRLDRRRRDEAFAVRGGLGGDGGASVDDVASGLAEPSSGSLTESSRLDSCERQR